MKLDDAVVVILTHFIFVKIEIPFCVLCIDFVNPGLKNQVIGSLAEGCQ